MKPHLRSSLGFLIGVAVVAALVVAGCNSTPKVDPRRVIEPRYTALPAKKVPDIFKDTVYEKCDLINTEPFLVSGYGFVSNLDGTGDTSAPNAVREYMVKEMIKHKWDSSLISLRTPTPEQALQDPRNAIVQVDGYLPPGVRKGFPRSTGTTRPASRRATSFRPSCASSAPTRSTRAGRSTSSPAPKARSS
jgi:hypothetical protein